ncbi:MAG: hypothetical protein DWQ05_03815 [Calditrichaeota bacterium]|nr:MAG: hypothetical protein DWQ05_03815 [Calditrichota bacterium]
MNKFSLLFMVALLSSNLPGQNLYNPGGRSLLHLHSAWLLEKGSLTLQTNTSSYYNTVIVGSKNNGPVGTTVWQKNAVAGLNYAPGKHLEWGLTYNLYQDTQDVNRHISSSFLELKIKAANFGGLRNHFRLGLVANTVLPMGDSHNLAFEPYASGTMQFGLTGLVSYSSELLVPESGFNFHANVGFVQHSDAGENLTGAATDTFLVQAATRELLYGAAMVFPTNRLDLGLEVFGRGFASRPPVTAYGREDYLYLAPFINYRLNRKISFKVGMDIRLLKDEDRTNYTTTGIAPLHPDLPNYPGWRLRAGFKFYLTKPEPRKIQKNYVATTPVAKYADFAEESPETLQERLVRERRKIEEVEQELERIRYNQRKMAQTLKNLRLTLHGETGNNPSDTEKEAEKFTEEIDDITTQKDGG